MLHTHDFSRDKVVPRSVLGAQPPPLPGASRDARARTRDARHAHHKSTRRALRAALIVTLVVFGLVLVVGGVYTMALRARAAAYGDRIAAQDNEVAQLRSELQDLRSERDVLASGRLPGLVPMEYDRALPLEQQYVRNIIFTQTGTSELPRYEYRLVVANGGTAPLRPAVRLLFFDERGIQVAESLVTEEASAAQPAAAAWLQPNETRSYSALVQLQHHSSPRYFLLVVQ
jgi:cell division protein FtsB